MDQSAGLALPDYVRILKGNVLLILLVAVLVIGPVAAYSFMATPQYLTSTRLYVSVRSSGGEDRLSDLTQGSNYARQTVVSYRDVVTSAAVLDRVTDDLGLPIPLEDLREMVEATSPADSVLIDIAVTGDNPQESADIANAVARHFEAVVTDVLEPPTSTGDSPIRITVIEPAWAPDVPVAPRPVRNIALGALAGLLLGVAAAIVRSMLDTRLSDPADLANVTDVPILGAIVDDRRAPKHPLVVATNPLAPRAESFRALRTNLRFVNVAGERRSYLITSSVAGEGKTTVATNLALCLAQTGDRVCLLDADMRRPAAADRMGVDGLLGLSSVLAGRLSVEDVLRPVDADDRLYLLPAGQVPPNPSELLGSARMAEVLKELTESFDYVVVDTPPVLAVTDAAIVSRLADVTLLVAAVGLVRRGEVATAVETLSGIANRLSGAVLMRVAPGRRNAYHYAGSEAAGQEDATPPRTPLGGRHAAGAGGPRRLDVWADG